MLKRHKHHANNFYANEGITLNWAASAQLAKLPEYRCAIVTFATKRNSA